MAIFAPNSAQVFVHVPFERELVAQNFAADLAGRVPQVNIIVADAALARAVRLLANAANKATVTFEYLPFNIGMPGAHDGRLRQRIACKFQAAQL
jgi:hypothetical protein